MSEIDIYIYLVVLVEILQNVYILNFDLFLSFRYSDIAETLAKKFYFNFSAYLYSIR